MSSDSDYSEEYGCRHTMSTCDCYENSDEEYDTTTCTYCEKPNPEHPYRIPKLHGGWIGYFCKWKHAEACNKQGGGNDSSRQALINKFKQLEEYWNATNPGY